LIKEIKKGDIPEWNFGDIAIKTYSFGEQMRIASTVSKFKETIVNGKKSMEPEFREELNVGELGVYMLAAGIHFVRNIDGTEFVVKPNMVADDKIKVVFNFSKESGNFLLNEIRDLNKPMSDEEKKD